MTNVPSYFCQQQRMFALINKSSNTLRVKSCHQMWTNAPWGMETALTSVKTRWEATSANVQKDSGGRKQDKSAKQAVGGLFFSKRFNIGGAQRDLFTQS